MGRLLKVDTIILKAGNMDERGDDGQEEAQHGGHSLSAAWLLCPLTPTSYHHSDPCHPQTRSVGSVIMEGNHEP